MKPIQPTTLSAKRFIVIRLNTQITTKDRYYYDWHTLAKAPLAARTSADRYDRHNPIYAKIHPQVKCVRVVVSIDPVKAKGLGGRCS